MVAAMMTAATVAVSQVPQVISYQGVVTDSLRVPVPNGTYAMTVTLYDAATGGTALWNEVHPSVRTFGGLFDVMLGSITPLNLSFDKQYWLAVSVNGSADLTPRTPLTSGAYAYRSAWADSAAAVAPGAVKTESIADAAVTPQKISAAGSTAGQVLVSAGDSVIWGGASGGVTSLNTLTGDVTLRAGSGTTITRSGQQITISAAGVTSINSIDAALAITDPTGPAVTLSLVPLGITEPLIGIDAVTTSKIKNNAVTPRKLDTTGAAIGQALTYTGAGVAWGNPIAAGLLLPFSGQLNDPNPGISVDNTGTGMGLYGLHSATTGTNPGVQGSTNSQDANAAAVVGLVTSTTPGGFSSGVRGINNGTGGLGIGVYGSQAGSGWGVYGTTPAGIGVYGNSSSGFGIYGLSNSGAGAYATSVNGPAAIFDITNNANASNAVSATTNGAGNAIVGTNSGTGRAGYFVVSNAASTTSAVEAQTNGTAVGSMAMYGFRGASTLVLGITRAIMGENSDGAGVAGVSNTGMGVYGASVAGDGMFGVGMAAGTGGVHGRNDAVNGYGVWGQSIGGGTGVYGISESGSAGFFQITNAASTSSTVNVSTSGIGSGVTVQLTNAANGARGIDVLQAGVGPGVFATSAGGNAVWGITSSISAAGVIGDNTFGEAVVGRNRGGNGVGAVVGRNDSSGYGVRGFNTKDGIGVLGQAGISGGTGVGGRFENVNAANASTTVQVATNGIGSGIAVQLTNAANGARGIDVTQAGVGPGVFATSAGGNAVWGITSSISAAGVIGDNTFGEAVVGRNRGGNGVGAVVGRNDSSGYGVRGFNTKNGIGVLGQAGISGGTGVGGRFENVNAANTTDVLQVVTNSAGNAARFTGNVVVTGNLTVSGTVAKGGGSFKIDHPLDPENKYLYHSFVESPDMMNIYNGVAVLDAGGEASVELPNWFEALNRDFRYQLTPIGAPGPNLYIAQEVIGNTFRIAGGGPGTKVSWQVTGIRHDPYANENRIQIEVDKPANERGTTLYGRKTSNPTDSDPTTNAKRAGAPAISDQPAQSSATLRSTDPAETTAPHSGNSDLPSSSVGGQPR